MRITISGIPPVNEALRYNIDEIVFMVGLAGRMSINDFKNANTIHRG